MFKTNNHSRGIANEMANMGSMQCSLGNTEIGLKNLETALHLHKDIGYEYGIATDLKLIGFYSLETSIEFGLEKLNEAIIILNRIKNYKEADALNNLIEKIKKNR